MSNVVDIIKNANSADRGKFDIKSIISSVGFSLIVSIVLIIVFSVLRPRNTVVYAPKVKYASEEQQPPRLKNTPWAWIKPVITTNEEWMTRLGLDAVVFLRFLRMMRNYLACITIIGIAVIIPINVIGTNRTASQSSEGSTNPLLRLTVAGLQGSWLYPHVGFSYVFTLTLLAFIWINYARVVQLRQRYFQSDEYQASLHARTLMLIDLPVKGRTDQALRDRVAKYGSFQQARIGREVGQLPALLEKHEIAVRKIEGILAKYLKHPDKLPPRPMCKGRNGRVDAIDYYTQRIQNLEAQIDAARDGHEKLLAKSYGFVSYPSIPAAHEVCRAHRSSDLFLAPRPLDIIWKNMGRPQGQRSTNRFFGNVLFFALCLLWTIPNALIATFISNIYNLGSVWPWFQGRINANPTLWAILQGILAPIILGLFFLVLPNIMRRISQWEGSLTRNSRERSVFSKLFLFFFINNFLIFTLFGVLWNFVQVTIVTTAQNGTGPSGFWNALKNSNFFSGLANAVTATSTFWIIYVAQRNLGCLLDLVQVWLLFLKWFKRTFLAPTPREMIEWSAPQPFDYASYYNTFLFNFAICLSYATLAPLILPFGLLYFVVSEFTYKYSMLYVSITKVESGGEFWRILINRLLLVAGFANIVLFVIIWIRVKIFTAIAVAPTLVILVIFKIVISRHFDPNFYYSTSGLVQHDREDRLMNRFGHPALHQKLMTPMVHERSKHLLRDVYKGRLEMVHKEELTDINKLRDSSSTMTSQYEQVKPDIERPDSMQKVYPTYEQYPDDASMRSGYPNEQYPRPAYGQFPSEMNTPNRPPYPQYESYEMGEYRYEDDRSNLIHR